MTIIELVIWPECSGCSWLLGRGWQGWSRRGREASRPGTKTQRPSSFSQPEIGYWYEDIVSGKPADNEHKTSKAGLGCRIGCSPECQVSLDEMTAIRRTRHKTNVWESTNPHSLSKEMTASDRVVNTRKRNSCEPKLCKEVFPTPFGEEGKSNEAKRRNKRGGCAMQCAMCT